MNTARTIKCHHCGNPYPDDGFECPTCGRPEWTIDELLAERDKLLEENKQLRLLADPPAGWRECWETMGKDLGKSMLKMAAEMRPTDERAEAWDALTAQLQEWMDIRHPRPDRKEPT